MALMFGLFMPDGTLFYILVPIVTFFLAIRYFSINNTTRIQYIIVLMIILSFIIYAISNSTIMDNKALFRNIVLIELFILFPFAINVKIPNIYIYTSLIIIFISQISYMIGFSPLTSFFNNYYPYEGDFYLYQSDYLQSQAHDMYLTNRSLRLGGLFHNANQCAKYLSIILAVYISENFKTTLISKLPFLIIYSLAIIGTGSRTGFMISILILLYYLYLSLSNKQNIIKYIYFFTIFYIITILLYSILNYEITSTYRFFDFKEGFDKSLFVKIGILSNYLYNNSSVLSLLLGNFNNDSLNNIQFDSEWGELIYRYGISIIIAFIAFFTNIYKKINRKYRIFLLALLWIISSTLILSYRAGFVFLLLLSKYFSDYRLDNNSRLIN